MLFGVCLRGKGLLRPPDLSININTYYQNVCARAFGLKKRKSHNNGFYNFCLILYLADTRSGEM